MDSNMFISIRIYETFSDEFHYGDWFKEININKDLACWKDFIDWKDFGLVYIADDLPSALNCVFEYCGENAKHRITHKYIISNRNKWLMTKLKHSI